MLFFSVNKEQQHVNIIFHLGCSFFWVPTTSISGPGNYQCLYICQPQMPYCLINYKTAIKPQTIIKILRTQMFIQMSFADT